MFRLRFLLLVSVACLVAAQETTEGTTPDSPSTSDSPGSTSPSEDIDPFVDNLGPVMQFDSTTASNDKDASSTTEEPSTTETPGNATSTTVSPSSATTMGVWSAASLALLAVAVMS